MSYCGWNSENEEQRRYHEEWGFPSGDDRKQFEHLLMEVMQCGLSWELMLKKRSVFGKCFLNADFERIAEFGEKDVKRILKTPGMIRSERKVRAVIGNAKAFLNVRQEYGSFSAYLMHFTGGKIQVYADHADGHIPSQNALSARVSRDLKKRGFRFLGPVVTYSHLQTFGIINDHDRDCPCFRRLLADFPCEVKTEDEEAVFPEN